MKKLILFCVLCMCLVTCKGAKLETYEDTIRDFYSQYIKEGLTSKVADRENSLDSLRKFYCSETFLNQIEDNELNHDIIVHQQYFSKEWLTTLCVKRDSLNHNIYHVSFISQGDTTKLRLFTIHQDNKFKIDSIIPVCTTDSGISQWIGYYEIELDLPKEGTSEPESSFVTYALDIAADTCIYYKLQLHSNYIYECKAVNITKNQISFEAIGDYVPNTEGHPLVVLCKREDVYYIKGPFTFDSNFEMDVWIKIDKVK